MQAGNRGAFQIGLSMPVFYIGLLLLTIFGAKLGWFPVGGYGEGFIEHLHHLFLPALTLAFSLSAIIMRNLRSAIIGVVDAEYVQFARAKGISERRLSYRHALRNAVLPLVTVVGTNVGNFLGGAVLTETVFSWPGVGRLMFDAMFQRDLNLLLSILVLSSAFVIIANLVVDFLYVIINPTVELK